MQKQHRQKPLFPSKIFGCFAQREFIFCLLAVFAWGLLAHAYGFLQDSFSHDALNAIYSGSVENTWKIQIGRFLSFPYRTLFRGALTVPWLIGVLSLFWISISVYLTVHMFKIKSRLLLVMVAGIFTANICVSCLTATYIHDLDIDMFALMMATCAAYSWYINSKKGFVLGAVFSFIALALYQSYISVTIVLIMFFCILSLLNGESFKKIWTSGLKAIAMILVSGILYIIVLKTVSSISGISFQTESAHSFNLLSENSVLSLLKGTAKAYILYIKGILVPRIHYSNLIRLILGLILVLPAVSIGIANIFSKRLKRREKLLLAVLVALIPVGSNVSAIIAQGYSHDLMAYSNYLTYMLALLIVYWNFNQNNHSKQMAIWSKRVTILSLCVMLGANVQISNGLYLKKDLEQEGTHSLMTRVLYRMEEHEDYITGETPVAFIGKSTLLNSSSYLDPYKKYTGMKTTNAIHENVTWYYNTYQTYFEYKLGNPAVMCDTDTWNNLYTNPEVIDMPAYPANGCMKMVDGIFVVKMGTIKPTEA